MVIWMLQSGYARITTVIALLAGLIVQKQEDSLHCCIAALWHANEAWHSCRRMHDDTAELESLTLSFQTMRATCKPSFMYLAQVSSLTNLVSSYVFMSINTYCICIIRHTCLHKAACV